MLPDLVDGFLTQNVSRESLGKLSIYHALLLKWQKAINLVSPKTLDVAKERHFNDSLQLLPHIPAGVKTLYDIGSGAGFPGLVLAICRPDIDVHLIESDERKGQFLRTVSRETSTSITIHTARIEETDLGAPDIVSARALADLSQLFGFCEQWAFSNPGMEMMFLKGRQADAEIADAQQLYQFEVDKFQSVTDQEASLLKVKELVKKPA